MTGYEYEKKCAQLLTSMGYTNVKVTPGSGDQGIDIIARKGGKKYGIQCKYYENTVGNKAVQEVFAGASFYDCDVAMVITNSKLTGPAKNLAEKLNVAVWEGIDAVYLRQHDAAYQKVQQQREQERLQREQERQRQEAEQARKREAEKKQKVMSALQQWQREYKKTELALDTRIHSEMKALERRFETRMQELQSYDQQHKALYERLHALNSENKELYIELNNLLPIFFIRRKKLDEQIAANRDAIEACSNNIKKNEQDHENAHQALLIEQHEAKKALLNTVTRELPEQEFAVDELKRLYKYLLWKCAMETAQASTTLKLEGMRQFVWLEFCSRRLNISLLEFQKRIPELNDFFLASPQKIALQLESDGMLGQTKRDTQRYYEANNLTRYYALKKDVCSALADYTEFDLNSAIDEMNTFIARITQENNDDAKLKCTYSMICHTVQSYGQSKDATVSQLIQDLFDGGYAPLKDHWNYVSNHRMSAWLRQLTEAGFLIRTDYRDYNLKFQTCYVHWTNQID